MMRTSIRRWPAVLGATAAVLVAGAVVASSPASATTSDALARCQAGIGGNFNTNVVVDQRAATFGDRFNIWPGDVLRVTATGGIKTDGWPWTPYFSADGVADPAPSGDYWPAPGLRKMSLVGDFNDTGQKVQLGRDSGCFVYTGPVRTFLWLQINDNWVLDNDGHWDVVIRQFW
jgi:hypothetical protein